MKSTSVVDFFILLKRHSPVRNQMSQFKLVFDWSTINRSDQRLAQVKFVNLQIIDEFKK